MSNMISKLTRSETELLISCEDRIALGEKTFVDVGLALSEIREKRLYRETHKTFEDYCRQRWGWTRMRASQLISAASVVQNVNQGLQGDGPDSERQARPLSALPPEKQAAAWGKANEKAEAEGKPVTARHVQEAVDEERPRVRTMGEEVSESHRLDWEANKIKAPAEHAESDDDSDALSGLKRYWRKAGKRDRNEFLQWITNHK